MSKYFYIVVLLILPFSSVFGQRGKKKKTKEPTVQVEEVPTFSAKDFPFIEKFHQAIREKISGNYREAKKLFLECLELRDDEDAVYFALAEIEKNQNNITAALNYYQKAYDIDPGNVVYLQELAYLNFEKANFEEAEVKFQKMVELEPRNIDFRYGYLKVLIYNKSYKEAIHQIDKMQEQVGLVPELSGMKADLYLEQKDVKRAEQTILELKKEYPDDLEVLRSVIAFYEQQKDVDKAFEAIKDLVKNDESNANAHFILAHHYERKNEIDDFKKSALIAIRSENLEVDKKLYLYEQLGKYEFAQSPLMFELAAELYEKYPEEGEVAFNYGETLSMQSKTKEALAVFRDALSYEKDNFDAWTQVLFYESKFMAYKELYEDGMEAVTLFPAIPFAYYSASEGALNTGKIDEAEELIAAGELFLLGDKRQTSLFNMRKGEIEFARKNYKQGIIHFEKALSIDPHSYVKVNYAYELAKAKVAQSVAKELLGGLKEEDKWPNKYYFAEALLHIDKKEYEKAYSILEDGIHKNHQTTAELYDFYGDLLFQQKKIKEAVEKWKLALEKGSNNTVLPKKIKEEKYYAPAYH